MGSHNVFEHGDNVERHVLRAPKRSGDKIVRRRDLKDLDDAVKLQKRGRDYDSLIRAARTLLAHARDEGG